MPIRVLSPQTAARIAAGEVIERPASVVKELVENALDAGATDIAVEIRKGGIHYIRVTDNGVGIPPDEVCLAFQRHATSKIDDTWNLESIDTLGFRGEALPSIAAVSTVTMTTRTPNSTAGHAIKLAGGEVLEEGPVGCPVGTSVTVQGLFDRVPARRKFLKSPDSERTRVADLMTRFALAFPGVRFRLIADGRESLASPGSGAMLDVLAAVYGAEVGQALLQVHHERDGYAVSGYISPPSVTRANRGQITFLVNHRWIQSRILMVAIEQSYHGLLQQGRYPIVVLDITVPMKELDINVHPAKREVRFGREDIVFSVVQQSVRGLLLARSPVPDMVLQQVPTTPVVTFSGPRASDSVKGDASPPDASSQERLLPKDTLPRLRVIGQMNDVYLVAEGPDGLYLIDQHAAHERVLFEQVRDAARRGETCSQSLLEPVSADLTFTQLETATSNMRLLESCGFVLEEFGERTFLVRGLPNSMDGCNPADALRGVLDLMATEFRLMEAQDAVAASIACHSAIRAGKSLTPQEMSQLVRQLEATENPHTCPHGRPTMIRLSAQELERQFGRR